MPAARTSSPAAKADKLLFFGRVLLPKMARLAASKYFLVAANQFLLPAEGLMAVSNGDSGWLKRRLRQIGQYLHF